MEQTENLALARIKEVDRMDEAQILAIMAGTMVEEYFYEFTDGRGRKQRGLSWAGIRELAQLRGNIVLDQPIVEERADHYRVMVKATDLERNVSVWGGTHQPTMQRVHARDHQGKTTGEYRDVPDEYAYEKAISKAQRNAIRNLMPVTVVSKLMDKLLVKPTGRQDGTEKRGAPRVVEGQVVQPAGPVKAASAAPEPPAPAQPSPSPSGEAQGPSTGKDIPVGPPKNVGELLTWCKDVFSLTRNEAFRLLNVVTAEQIADLGDAWNTIRVHKGL